MSSQSDAAAGAEREPEPQDRRRNLALRALIDEMLFQVRGLQREDDAWSAAERAKAEAELARIMARVRDAAVSRERGGNQTP